MARSEANNLRMYGGMADVCRDDKRNIFTEIIRVLNTAEDKETI